MTLGRIVAFVLCILILTSITTISSLVYGQKEEQVPQVNDKGLQTELITDVLTDPTTIGFLGDDDILVLEKAGTVQRIGDDGSLDEQLLNVNAYNKDEQGLLGVEVVMNENGTPPYVFLSYTEKVVDDSSGEDEARNRLYRYQFHNDELVNPKLLLDLPADPGPAHNGGVITVGPDDNIYM